MFYVQQKTTLKSSAFAVLERIFHATVRNIRQAHGNAIIGLIRNIFQNVVLIGSFFIMIRFLGMQATLIRGDTVLYIMTGIFMYMTHVKAVSNVFMSEGPSSAMMKHTPMTPAVSIASSALAALYIQVLSAVVILVVYHTAFNHITVNNWAGTLGMLVLAWFTGVAVGIVMLAIKPWSPDVATMLMQVYTRMNMIASGKFFVANSLPHHLLVIFDWNPLFHIIDQTRGFVFLNYNPHFSNWHYALYVGLTVLMVGLMGEFFTRQRASVSWGAKH